MYKLKPRMTQINTDCMNMRMFPSGTVAAVCNRHAQARKNPMNPEGGAIFGMMGLADAIRRHATLLSIPQRSSGSGA
jgi:hypothetical protein